MNVEKKKTVVILSGIAALVMLAACGFVFLNFRTTLIVTWQVCRAEHVSEDDYLEFRVFENGETRASFKAELESRIRKDVALEKWMEEEPVVRTMLKNDKSIQEDIITLLTFAGKCEDQTYEGLMEAFHQVTFTGTFDELCREHSLNTEEVASYLAGLYAEDVFYLQDTESGADNAIKKLAMLADTEFESDEKVYKLNITEYDPLELCAEQEAYESEYMELCRARLGGDSEYDYIVRKTLTAYGDDSFGMTVFAAANTETYSILGLDVSVPNGTEHYIPGFSLNIDGSSSVYADEILKTVRLDSAALRETTDPYAELFDSLFDPLVDDAALEEMYSFFYAHNEELLEEAGQETEAENSEAEVPDSEVAEAEENGSGDGEDAEEENGSEDGQDSEKALEYKDLSFVQQMNALGEKIEKNYPVENDWGLLNIFSMYEYTVEMLGAGYVDYQYLVENFDELFAQAQDKVTLQEELEKNSALFGTLRDMIRDAGAPEFAGVENIREWELSAEEFDARYGSYLHKWYPDAETPVFLYAADVKYSAQAAGEDGEFYSLQFTVAVTDSGMRIIGMNVKFNEVLEGALGDYASDNLWQEPNYILMRSLAEAAVNREDYAAEEEYDRAVAGWLYQNYPEYYNNPDSQQSSSRDSCTASGYSTRGMGSLWSNIKEGVSEGANGILDWADHADESIRNWGSDMMWYLDQIWFEMGAGNYGDLPFLITYGTDKAIEIGNEIKETAVDAWNDVKDWWGGLW